jgi:hypothetical protein
MANIAAVDEKILKDLGVVDTLGVYVKICNIGGYGVSGNYKPTLDLTGLDAEKKAAVDKVIADALPSKSVSNYTKKSEDN